MSKTKNEGRLLKQKTRTPSQPRQFYFDSRAATPFSISIITIFISAQQYHIINFSSLTTTLIIAIAAPSRTAATQLRLSFASSHRCSLQHHSAAAVRASERRDSRVFAGQFVVPIVARLNSRY